MEGSYRSLLTLAVTLLFVISIPVSGAAAIAPTDSLSSDDTFEKTGDDPLNETDEPLNETDDPLEETDETSDEADETVNETDGTVNETVDDGEEQIDDTIEDSDEPETDTVNATEETVDDTNDAVAESVEETEAAVTNTTQTLTEELHSTTDDINELHSTTDDIIDVTGLAEQTDVGGVDSLLETTQVEAHVIDRASEQSTDSGHVTGSNEVSNESATSTTTANQTGSVAATGQDESDEGGTTSSGTFPGGTSGTGAAVGALAVGVALVARTVGVSGVVASSGASGSSLLGGIGSLLRGWMHRLLILIGYKRYSDDDPLEHEARKRLYETIESSPGSYLAEISEQADVPKQTARYHLRILAFENLVSQESIRGRQRYFPVGSEWAELEAALNDESTAAIIESLNRDGPDSVSGLAERLGKDPSTVSHHLDRLAEDGLVTRERDGRAVTNKLSTRTEQALDAETESQEKRVPKTAD